MRTELALADRFFKVLVEEIRESHPEYLDGSFTVAEVYQSLVPYRTHRDRIGAEMSGDYEDALLRLLAGEGGYLELDSDTARERIRLELRSSNPNTGMYREYAAVRVRLSADARESLPPSGVGARVSTQTELEVEGLADSTGKAAGGSKGTVVGGPGSAKGEAGAAPLVPEEAMGMATGRKPATAPDPGLEPSPSRSPRAESRKGPEERTRETVSGGPDREGEPSRPRSCPDCGEELPDRASLRFCAKCGTNVFVAPCGACGEVLERSWKFCIACGVPAPQG
jgi:hypothetical protein